MSTNQLTVPLFSKKNQGCSYYVSSFVNAFLEAVKPLTVTILTRQSDFLTHYLTHLYNNGWVGAILGQALLSFRQLLNLTVNPCTVSASRLALMTLEGKVCQSVLELRRLDFEN